MVPPVVPSVVPAVVVCWLVLKASNCQYPVVQAESAQPQRDSTIAAKSPTSVLKSDAAFLAAEQKFGELRRQDRMDNSIEQEDALVDPNQYQNGSPSQELPLLF